LSLAHLERQQQDALAFRNNELRSYYTRAIASGSFYRVGAHDVEAIARARFSNTRAELAADQTLENILIVRQLTTQHDIDNTSDLIDRTRAIVRSIEEERAQ
jgi:hypothetical protein